MAEKRTQRRLAAIIATDVVGYSRLMGKDEEGTLSRLKKLRSEFLHPKVAEYGGRIVKTTGDGTLIEFGSAVDAVSHAIDVQRGLAKRNAELPDSEQIHVRLGINVGDIIIEAEDIYGDGVNVAARLEALADPGGICISHSVYRHIKNKAELSFVDMGPQLFKNIEQLVRTYRIIVSDNTQSFAANDSDKVVTHSDKPSIAVLPFNNLSGDPEQEYFSDGMAEDLITDISKISGLFVVARNSSFAFKGKTIDVKEIAAKLGVRHILEGSVRKMGDKLRINAQLIDAASGGHIWAERYDGDMADIFEFQDNIREQIVSALQVSLTPIDKALTERKPTDSVEAYDLFLRGRASFYHYTPEDVLEAVKFFDKAIEFDPNFADAHGWLSYCHFYGWAHILPGFDDTLDRAYELAERGVALDGTSAFALARLGWIQTFLRRYDQALANLEKATDLAPGNADVRATFGQILNFWGNPERALEMMEKAFSIDTIVPPSWDFQVGVSRFLLRQNNEALARLELTVKRVPKFIAARLFLACVYVELDRLDDATNVIKTIPEFAPQFKIKRIVRNWPFRIEAVRDRVLYGLRKAGLPEE